VIANVTEPRVIEEANAALDRSPHLSDRHDVPTRG
jgi:hypothetical protein